MAGLIVCELHFRGLGLGDGAVGAGAFAGAAVDAFVSVDLVSGLTGGDGAYGAYLCAGAAGYANFGIDNSCHFFFICR